MDVSFLEHQPFYSKINIQGENIKGEYQFWETLNTKTKSPMSSLGPQIKNPTEIPSPHLIPTQNESITPLSPHLIPTSPHLIPTQTESITPIQTENSQPIPSPPKSQSQNTDNQEFIVYNRRNKTQKEVELQKAAQ